jgi:hypothetical protein
MDGGRVPTLGGPKTGVREVTPKGEPLIDLTLKRLVKSKEDLGN